MRRCSTGSRTIPSTRCRCARTRPPSTISLRALAGRLEDRKRKSMHLQPRRHTMRSEVKERIDREIREHPVTIYMKGTEMFPRCGFSAATVEALRRPAPKGASTRRCPGGSRAPRFDQGVQRLADDPPGLHRRRVHRRLRHHPRALRDGRAPDPDREGALDRGLISVEPRVDFSPVWYAGNPAPIYR